MTGLPTLSWGYGGTPWLASLGHDLTGSADDVTRTFGARSVVGEIGQVTLSNTAYRFTGYAGSSKAYGAANGLNQLASASGESYGHDARGNVTSIAVTGQATRTFGYTADNKLATGGSHAFGYDPLDRLMSLSASNTRLRYGAYGELVGEYDASGAYVRRYVHGDGADEPLVWYEGNSIGVRRHLHADERGSVIAVTDGAGSVTNKLAYDEHGVPASGNVGRFQYTGQTWLPEIAAYNYKARIYAPTLGRFLQPDPIGYADGMNLYAYVGGDPVNLVDPSGLCGWSAGGTVYGEDGTVYEGRVYERCTSNDGNGASVRFDGGSPSVTTGGGRPVGQPAVPPPPPPPLCPSKGSKLAKAREQLGKGSQFLGDLSTVAALAGVIPNPASPELLTWSAGVRVGSFAAGLGQVGASALHGFRSGNFGLFRRDLSMFSLSLTPTGQAMSMTIRYNARLANRAVNMREAELAKRGADAYMSLFQNLIKDPCS